MNAMTWEVNFDGLVGPTHNYAGLSLGNLASQRSAQHVSDPRSAALQGLAKLRELHHLGVKQAVLPPHDRPHVMALRQLGFTGTDTQVIQHVARTAPELLEACASSSSMWAANAATVSPSPDTSDGRLHVTPANLISQFHRSLEASTTYVVLKHIFADARKFIVHKPLPSGVPTADEGAANHTRLCSGLEQRGVEVFVYGREGLKNRDLLPKRYPARQTGDASKAIARWHGLDPNSVLFVQQNPDAIDAGVFHNDVIAVGHANVLLCHEQAFRDQAQCIDRIRHTFESTCGVPLNVIQILEDQVPLADAVSSYLFNSQLVGLPDDTMALIYPRECTEMPSTAQAIQEILAGDNPIRVAHMVDVRQSMNNGGGPACLRLRVVMTRTEIQHALPGIFVDGALLDRLVRWVSHHYREQLTPADLGDPKLLDESRAALDELTQILGLGSIYPFQCAVDDDTPS